MPVTFTNSTTASPPVVLNIWCGKPLSVSCTAGSVAIACTLVHCSTSWVALIALTVVSALPCQIDTFGHGPVWLEARRTRSPQAAGVKVPSPPGDGGHNQGKNRQKPGGSATLTRPPPGRPPGSPV